MSYERYEQFTMESFRIMQGMIQSNRGLSKLFHDRMAGFLSEPALDPFSVLKASDEDTLHKRLEKLSIVQLFSVIYGFNLAPAAIESTQTKKEPLIDHIILQVNR